MLRRGILTIFKANVLALFFNVISNFILPKYLSVEAYALIKTFQLYIIYVGVFHFGYTDGMYLSYGGKKLKEIPGKDIKEDIQTMRTFQLIVFMVSLISCIFVRDIAWFAFMLTIIPLNMASYYKLLMQATGEFSAYGKITNITTIFTFCLNVVLLFVFSVRDSGAPYIFAYIAIDVIIWISVEIYAYNTYSLKKIKANISLRRVVSNVRDGILLTLGNLSTTLFTGMDRWFVKFLMNTLAFAQYSFAVSIEAFLNVAITPISITLYNYFCKHKDNDNILNIVSLISVFACGLPVAVFPAKFILEHFLENYLESANVLVFLFAAQIFGIIVKCIFTNLYKAQKRQRQYFIKLIIVLIAGAVFNGLFFALLETKESFAIATMLSTLLWLILSSLDFPETRLTSRQWLFVGIQCSELIVLGIYFNSIVGFLLYVVGYLVSLKIFLNANLTDLKNMIFSLD